MEDGVEEAGEEEFGVAPEPAGVADVVQLPADGGDLRDDEVVVPVPDIEEGRGFVGDGEAIGPERGGVNDVGAGDVGGQAGVGGEGEGKGKGEERRSNHGWGGSSIRYSFFNFYRHRECGRLLGYGKRAEDACGVGDGGSGVYRVEPGA